MASLSQSFCVPEPRKFETFMPRNPKNSFNLTALVDKKATLEKGSTGQITTA
jgi:hypothetical protein